MSVLDPAAAAGRVTCLVLLSALAGVSLVACASTEPDGQHMDDGLLPQSVEELVAQSPVIVLGEVTSLAGALTVAEPIPTDMLTAIVPEDTPDWSEVVDDFEFRVLEILQTDVDFEVEETIILRMAGGLPSNQPPFVGDTYLLFGAGTVTYPHPPDTIDALGGNYGLIQADDLDGPVVYAHGEQVEWASELTVQDLIDSLEDEINN